MSKKKSKTNNRQQRKIDSNNNFIDRVFSTNTIIAVILLLAITIIARVGWVHSQSSIKFPEGLKVQRRRPIAGYNQETYYYFKE